MEVGNDIRYFVVEFLDPPYSGFDKYICVPRSWVETHIESKNLVVVKYPVEKSSKIKQRVKDDDVSSIDWSIYVANLKYCTDSYQDAQKITEALENRAIMEQHFPEPINEGIDEAHFNDNVEPGSERPPLNNFEKETHRGQAYVDKFANSTDKLTNQTPTSSKSMNTKKLPSTSKRSLEKSIQKMYSEKSNNVEHRQVNDNSASKTGNYSSMNSDIPKSTNESLYSTTITSTPINYHIHVGYYDSIATTSEDTVAQKVGEEGQVAKKTQVEKGGLKKKEKKEASDERDDDDENEEFSKKYRREPRRFTLPPEYDKNDSKWTLRYRQSSSELIELIEGSGIYVNAAMLLKCQRSARDSIELARMLLLEIFTENALRTCVFTAVNSSAYSDDGSIKRPVLDENAKTVLLKYVEEYAQTKNWPKVERLSIILGLRRKIQAMRRY